MALLMRLHATRIVAIDYPTPLLHSRVKRRGRPAGFLACSFGGLES
jgi:hypothetical protein